MSYCGGSSSASQQIPANPHRAYEVHPDQWTKIAAIVDRTEADCRDRWKNELQHRDVRRVGKAPLKKSPLAFSKQSSPISRKSAGM